MSNVIEKKEVTKVLEKESMIIIISQKLWVKSVKKMSHEQMLSQTSEKLKLMTLRMGIKIETWYSIDRTTKEWDWGEHYGRCVLFLQWYDPKRDI